uniref:Uncharacterized protein n=1 Tax=Anguilla anguilla TaxID=7936 RepID=A0A0E9UFU3_ANGAN
MHETCDRSPATKWQCNRANHLFLLAHRLVKTNEF